MPDRRWWELPRAGQVALVGVLALAVAALTVLAARHVSAPVAGAGSTPTPVPSTPASPTPSTPSGPVDIALIGDAAVQDPAGAAAADWTALTVQGLQASGGQVAPVVAAADGAGYVTRSPSGEAFPQLVARAVTPTTRVVVLLGSRNDLTAAGEVGDAARVTFAAVHRAAPDAALLVVGPVPVPGDASDRLTGVRDALRDAAAAGGAAFVDPLAEGWSFPPGTATASRSRGLRLTATGQAAVAQRLLPHLLPLVPVTASAAP